MVLFVLQRVILLFFAHMIYAPVWWCTSGVVRATRGLREFFMAGNDVLSPGLWLRNLFVPMFGQRDVQGRLVSFFIRLVNVTIRAFFLGIWTVIIICGYLAWIILPFVLLYLLVIVL